MDYFGRTAYLAQSPQYFKQAMVGAFERVYEIGPVFRAEPHDTARHLAEYLSMDAELRFVADHHDVIAVCSTPSRAWSTRWPPAAPPPEPEPGYPRFRNDSR